METMRDPGASHDEESVLGYEQTVPRALVHRWSLSEVFLTGICNLDAEHFTATAQLPLSHAYYGDHLGGQHRYDPLLVLETGRQAVTAAAHVNQGAPPDTTFMVTSWSLHITHPDTLTCGKKPGELHIDGTVTDRFERGGRLRRLGFAMELMLDGATAGRLTMLISCTPTNQYHALRRMQRGSEVPTAFTVPTDPAGEPVLPGTLQRLDPRNVVLDDARCTESGAEAVLSPRSLRNRSMYDHPYDHVPGMVFTEAARQCATALLPRLGDDRDAPDTPTTAPTILRIDGKFEKFAELDAPVHLTLRPKPEEGLGSYVMTARQSEADVAEVSVLFA